MPSPAQPLVFAKQTAPAIPVSKARLWTGRILTALTVLFMLFDAVGKFMMPHQVVEAFARLGFPLSFGVPLGIVLTVSTVLYAIPRTSVLGVVLLTGYLGGAIAIQMRAGSPLFETIFPAIFGVIAWAGIYLRDAQVGALLPLRSATNRS
jgi:hypothetical protein